MKPSRVKMEMKTLCLAGSCHGHPARFAVVKEVCFTVNDFHAWQKLNLDLDMQSETNVSHFDVLLNEKTTSSLENSTSWKKIDAKIQYLGKGCFHASSSSDTEFEKSKEAIDDEACLASIKQSILDCLDEKTADNDVNLHRSSGKAYAFKRKLFSTMCAYQDLYFSNKTPNNSDAIRQAYCLHVLNHTMKRRKLIVSTTLKLKNGKGDENEEHRDQGFTRPSVLIVVPFRNSAYKIVTTLMSFLREDKSNVPNKQRFLSEYGPKEEEDMDTSKPEDYSYTFAGNTDDHFRLGISVTKNTLKLYSQFYKADIIIASPLGLRTAIGTVEEKNFDADFLSSIEICIADEVDIFLMQNWDHFQYVFQNLNRQPKESHGVDITRVRMWNLDNLAKFYRQTLMFSSFQTPLINGMFSKHCLNYAGKWQIHADDCAGSMRKVLTPLSQVFHKLDVRAHAQVPDARFQFFVNEIVPKMREETMKGCLVFVHSYLDFVRLRNYMKKERIDFVSTHEYTKPKSITRARGLFFHGKVRILLFTERFHFYQRFRIRGIQHLFFYDLPLYAHLYSELCNMAQDAKRQKLDCNFSCTVMYSVYDGHKLARIVGSKRATEMISSSKNLHMLVMDKHK